MEWQLIEVKDIDCAMDNSGIYTVIHRKTSDKTHKGYADYRVFVRIDIMRSCDDIPLISFYGLENNVRKHVMRWLDDNACQVSTEHASYIGRELHRATTDINYIQE